MMWFAMLLVIVGTKIGIKMRATPTARIPMGLSTLADSASTIPRRARVARYPTRQHMRAAADRLMP